MKNQCNLGFSGLGLPSGTAFCPLGKKNVPVVHHFPEHVSTYMITSFNSRQCGMTKKKKKKKKIPGIFNFFRGYAHKTKGAFKGAIGAIWPFSTFHIHMEPVKYPRSPKMVPGWSHWLPRKAGKHWLPRRSPLNTEVHCKHFGLIKVNLS